MPFDEMIDSVADANDDNSDTQPVVRNGLYRFSHLFRGLSVSYEVVLIDHNDRDLIIAKD